VPFTSVCSGEQASIPPDSVHDIAGHVCLWLGPVGRAFQPPASSMSSAGCVETGLAGKNQGRAEQCVSTDVPVGLFLCRTGEPLNEVYGQDVLFVANDWHAALLPLLLTARFRPYGVYANARCCLAIHNLAHQGSHEASRCGGSSGRRSSVSCSRSSQGAVSPSPAKHANE
jgi:hypothetical protein